MNRECLDLKSEITKEIENVRLVERYSGRKNYVGNLYLTTSHLVFRDPECRKELWLLYSHISSVEKSSLTTCGSPLVIRCKTFLCVTFIIQKDRDSHDVYTSLLQLVLPPSVDMLYCFRYKALKGEIPMSAGWNFYDLNAEYERMQVPNEDWCLTLMNKNYELCDTYPHHLYVPATATPAILQGSSKFRSRGRLPVLTYLHKNKAVICRCSQPLSGFSARCLEDEQLLDCILRTNPHCKYMYVIDTRPKINAMASRAAGRGYENENFYDNIKFQFFGIENIHVMRNSLAKLIESCDPKSTSVNSFLGGIDASGWLRHIKALLDTAWFIAQAVNSATSVLVHCSDGWDRTAQVCSLACILLDPYYRTIQGYQTLIEKDWLAFGHKFSDRYGFVAGDAKEISPVFTQFIEATWQLYCQFQQYFQFNERYLIMLHDQFTSCQFGTFVGNCERDRVNLRVSSRAFSLWGYVAHHMHEFVNPLYSADDTKVLMEPDLCSQNFRFWRGLYCRFESGVHPRENLEDIILSTVDHTTSLEDHINFLLKKKSAFMQLISNAGNSVRNAFTDSLSRLTVDDGNPSNSNCKENGNTIGELIPAIRLTDEKGQCIDDVEVLYDELISEVNSISLDWKALRNAEYCSCLAPFEYSSKKYHCWKCGDIFCVRCMNKQPVPLPGYQSKRAVPICSSCYNRFHSNSNSNNNPNNNCNKSQINS